MKRPISKMLYFEKIPSTHLWVKANKNRLYEKKFYVVYTFYQTDGIGRQLRHWYGKEGRDLFVTCYTKAPLGINYAPIGEIVALAISYVLEDRGLTPQIKWPNDLLLDEKKCGGILCEALSSNTHIDLIMSFGLNVNSTAKDFENIDQSASSLFTISQKRFSLPDLLQDIMEKLLSLYLLFLDQGFSAVYQQIDNRLAFKNKNISYKQQQEHKEATLLGLNQDGSLRVKEDKKIKNLYSEEIFFLRKL